MEPDWTGILEECHLALTATLVERDALQARLTALTAALKSLESHNCFDHGGVWCSPHKSHHCAVLDAALDAAGGA